MAETQEMWSRRDNRSNQRTDLAYCLAWSKHGLRPVKSRNWSLKNSSTEARSISALEMQCTAGLRFPFTHPGRLTTAQWYGARRAGSKLYLLDRLAWAIHPVTSRLRTLGRAIGSGASTRLASETCCCSLMGRTNRLVALSSRPVLHWRQDDARSLSRLTLSAPIAETSRRSWMLSRPLLRCRRLRAATRPASPARTARNPRLGLAIHHSG